MAAIGITKPNQPALTLRRKDVNSFAFYPALAGTFGGLFTGGIVNKTTQNKWNAVGINLALLGVSGVLSLGATDYRNEKTRRALVKDKKGRPDQKRRERLYRQALAANDMVYTASFFAGGILYNLIGRLVQP